MVWAIVHMSDLRLRNNAGIDYPCCKADRDLENKRFQTTTDKGEVTCEACKREYRRKYGWAGGFPAITLSEEV